MPRDIYAFDVDGTLTSSRGTISKDMKETLDKFLKNNYCIIVTGSDPAKTIEQIGQDTYDLFKVKFQCCGNHIIHVDGSETIQDLGPVEDMHEYMEIVLSKSDYPVKAGNHIEYRQGMVNLSFVGRNCTQEQREEYYKWDKENQQRAMFAEEFDAMFPEFMAQIGGEISLDIFRKDKDKRQVRNWYPNDTLHFFGDKCQPGGNDYSLAQVADYVYHVSGPEDTLRRLKR